MFQYKDVSLFNVSGWSRITTYNAKRVESESGLDLIDHTSLHSKNGRKDVSNNGIYCTTYHSILRYPLAQQWRLLNFCATTYSWLLSSFVNCNHVELLRNVSMTQKSSSPFTTETLNMIVTVNANTTQRSHADNILDDWAFEVTVEYDIMFTLVTVLYQKSIFLKLIFYSIIFK